MSSPGSLAVFVLLALAGCRDYAHFDRVPDAAADGSANVDAGPDSDGGVTADGGGPVRLLQLDGQGAATDAVALVHDGTANSNLLLRVPAILGPQPGGAQSFKIGQRGALFAAGPNQNGEAHVLVADATGTMTEYRWTGSMFEGVGMPVGPLPSSLAVHAVAILQLNAGHPQLVTVQVNLADAGASATVLVYPGSATSLLDGVPASYPLATSFNRPQHDALSLVVSHDRAANLRSLVAFLPSLSGNGGQAMVLPGTSTGFGSGVPLNPGTIMTAHTVATAPVDVVADHALPLNDNIVFGTDDGVEIFTLYPGGSQDQYLFQTMRPVYALQVVDWNRDGAPDLFSFLKQFAQGPYAATIFQNRGRITQPDFTVVSSTDNSALVATMSPDSLRSPAVPDCGAVAVFVDPANAQLSIFRP